MPERPEVSVVIPSWNGRELLAETLPAVMAERRRFGAERLEVLIADDASGDGTAAWLAGAYPAVRLARRRRRGGFGETANTGARAARGRLLLLLNNDLAPEPGFVERLREALLARRAFAAAPRVRAWDGREVACARVSGALRRGRLIKELRAGDPERGGWSLYAMGGAALYDAARFAALGGFDPLFAPFYGEDADLCWRAWRRGWPTVYEPGAAARHRGGATIARLPAGAVAEIMTRNGILVFLANAAGRGRLAEYALGLLPRLAWLAWRGEWRAVRAQLAALGRLGEVARRRRRERAFARLGDEEIERLVAEGTGELSFADH